MKFIVTRTIGPSETKLEADEEHFPALIAAYIQFLTPNSGTITIERLS